MVRGVSDGFETVLEYEGVGYKADVKQDQNVPSGQVLELSLGFSHPVKIPAPVGITFKTGKGVITISGADKEMVTQTAANIRRIRPPEPYKGKGIRYRGEQILRKAGKKAVGAGT
jgi:large subunit ribosomal protein L6